MIKNILFLALLFFLPIYGIPEEHSGAHAMQPVINNTQNIIPHNSMEKTMVIEKTMVQEKSSEHMKMGQMPFSWANPKIKPSSSPKLMGKQMGQVNTIGVPPLGYELDGNVKVFHLIVQPIEQVIVDEKYSTLEGLMPKENQKYHTMSHVPKYQKMKGWGYNGISPGPTIEVIDGDRVRIIVKNELPEPTSIHWHGIELPNDQDGATPETAAPIMPGKTFTYEFTLYQTGTFMYHSGFNVMKQDHMGLQ